MFRDLTARYLADVDIELVMRSLARVAEFDRYQASRGVNDAAAYVAETAQTIGLHNVRVERFVADGARRWWTFRAPVAWTPVRARLEGRLGGRAVFQVDHVQQPFTIATHSAATPGQGLSAPLVDMSADTPAAKLTGAVAIVRQAAFRGCDVAARLLASGALGFVTDGPSCEDAPGGAQPGRIELAAPSPLFGFSVTTAQLGELALWAARGAWARVAIDIDRTAAMPVVQAEIEGDPSVDAVLFTAHLCHPRPGANDNASGVAALLGIADMHLRARHRSGAPLRFQWGPEFVATAAMLHRDLTQDRPLPGHVINLDMVGEDQALCGGPFVVERSPELTPSLINPIAEAIVEAVFQQTADAPGAWRAVDFLGFSDHALFADPRIARPAIQLCHSDRFNHSAADTLDKVSAVEMRRAAAAAAAIGHALADTGQTMAQAKAAAVDLWRRRTTQEALILAARYRCVQAGRWSEAFLAHVEANSAALQRLASGDSSPPTRPEPAGAALVGTWSGPVNVRAMIEDLPAPDRDKLLARLRQDKSTLALLFNLAIQVDGRRSRDEVVQAAGFTLRRPIPAALGDELLGYLEAAGWVASGPARLNERATSEPPAAGLG